MILILIVINIFSSSMAIKISQPSGNETKSQEHNIYTAQIGFHANIYHDLYLLKNSMKTVEDQINKLHNVYDNKFDRKLSSLFHTIMNMEGNLKNIQDRAHVWDVFQHHISAWNEQIKSLDRKVDIISSGQEKMLLLDGKLGFLLNLEYNSQRIVNKLSIIEDKLDSLENKLGKDIKSPTIFDEFATRGVLSTLKTLEHKVERSNVLLHQVVSSKKTRENNMSSEVDSQNIGRGKYIVTCATPTIVEELMKDMSSKVDLVYDKIITDTNNDDEENVGSTEDSIENEYPENYQADDENSGKPIVITKSDKKSVRKIFKHLCPPAKKIENILNETRINQELLYNIKDTLQIFEGCYSKETFLDIVNGTLFTKLRNLTDSRNKVFLSALNKIQETQEKSHTYLKEYINNFLKNVTKIFQKNSILAMNCCSINNTILDINDDSTFNYIEEESTVLPQNNEPDSTADFYPSSTEDNTFESSTDSQFESTTSNSDMIDESDIPSIYDVYYINLMDLSNEIINRTSLTNHMIDFCQNPGSERYCDDEGYITIQSRIDKTENFSRSWEDYKWGFGNLDSGNFWIGNEAIHSLTLNRNDYSFSSLKIVLEDFDGNIAIARFNNFTIESEDNFYRLVVGEYSGNASDSFSYHNNAKFSTFDKSNDEAPSCCPCSKSYGGGWWFKSCFESNLNGVYYDKPTEDDFRGIIWEHWSGETSLAKTKMSVKMVNDWKNRKISAEDP